MPLIRIDVDRETFEADAPRISDAVHAAQLDVLGITPDDVFQIFQPHDVGEIMFSPTFGGVDRRKLTVITITLVRKHPVTLKKALYSAILERLEAIGLRRDDIQIVLVENAFEDWFAGRL